MDTYCAWKKSGGGKYLRILAAILSICVLTAVCPGPLRTSYVFAAEEADEDGREQTTESAAQAAAKDGTQDKPENSVQDSAQDNAKDGMQDSAQDNAKDGMQDGAQDNAKDGVQDGMQDSVKEGMQDKAGNNAQDSTQDSAKEGMQDKAGNNAQDSTQDSVKEGMQDMPENSVQDNAQDKTGNNKRISTENEIEDDAEEDVKYGAPRQVEAAWQTVKNGEWNFGSLTQAVSGVYSGGMVVLLSDVSLTAGLTVSKSMIITSNESQNPCTIRNVSADSADGNETGRIFTVAGVALRLEDIILDGGREDGVVAYHPLICVAGGVQLGPGAILQNAENAYPNTFGGGITIRYGQVYMEEGSKIVSCKAVDGGGVGVNSKTGSYKGAGLKMNGGSIEDCEADNGGGVYVNVGLFQMDGGTVQKNRALKQLRHDNGGGGVFVGGTGGGAAFVLNEGEIKENSARNGGGVLVLGSGMVQFQMRGGTVKENLARNGAGISVLAGVLEITGGTVTGNKADTYGGGILGCPDSDIKMQGNPGVYGNTTEGEFDNFYLDGNEDNYPDFYCTVPIQLTGPLGEDARMGMSRWVRPDDGDHPSREMVVPAGGYTITEDDLDKLYADNKKEYALILHDDKILMVLAVDVTLNEEELLFDQKDKTADLIATVTPKNAVIKDVTWTSSDPSVATVDADGRVTAVDEGTAVITVTTVSPYNAEASCKVTVSFEPVKEGYRFVGFRGTDLTQTEHDVTIPAGSTGARSYTAVWEKEENTQPVVPENPDKPEKGEKDDHAKEDKEPGQDTENGQSTEPGQDTENGQSTGSGQNTENGQSIESGRNTKIGQNTEDGQNMENGRMTESGRSAVTTKNPRTGTDIVLLYASALLSVLGMLLFTVLKIRMKKRKRERT